MERCANCGETIPADSPGGGFPKCLLAAGLGTDGSDLDLGPYSLEALGDGRLTPEEALAIVPQICDALQYAHDRGVVHRIRRRYRDLLRREIAETVSSPEEVEDEIRHLLSALA